MVIKSQLNLCISSLCGVPVKQGFNIKGASINDVPILGVFFDPLPPPCPNFIYWPFISKVQISCNPSLPLNLDIIYGCSQMEKDLVYHLVTILSIKLIAYFFTP